MGCCRDGLYHSDLHPVTLLFSWSLSRKTEDSGKFDCRIQEVKKEPNYYWKALKWSFVWINCWLSPYFSSCKPSLHPETGQTKLSNQFTSLEQTWIGINTSEAGQTATTVMLSVAFVSYFNLCMTASRSRHSVVILIVLYKFLSTTIRALFSQFTFTITTCNYKLNLMFPSFFSVIWNLQMVTWFKYSFYAVHRSRLKT